MFHRILILFLLFSMVCCRQNHEHDSNKKSLQDSAIASYIKIQDSLFESKPDFFGNDNNEPDYIFLKSIYNKDTEYLKRVITYGQQLNTDTTFSNFWRTSIPNLKTLRCNEAYQFEYSETFCDFAYIITIYKINDTINLSKVIVRHTLSGDNKLDKLEVYQQENKRLSIEDWHKFITSIELADYWNLKNRDNKCVLDPSSLSVKGIKKTRETNLITDIKSVQRLVFRKSALYQTFLLVLKFSSIEKVCGH